MEGCGRRDGMADGKDGREHGFTRGCLHGHRRHGLAGIAGPQKDAVGRSLGLRPSLSMPVLYTGIRSLVALLLSPL
jgi:hypothetical protein